jgi:hypothetical protein
MVYLVGSTYDYLNISNTVIPTTGAHQTTYGGGWMDAFLVKFDASGNRIWGTYYGGEYEEYGYSCSTDTSGNVYLSGITGSTNAIATSGAHQTTHGNGGYGYDAFLVKFDASGTRLWGTYYGGNFVDSGYATSCMTDKLGNVYLAGSTGSSNGIATPGAHQTTPGSSFLVKFDASGTRLWGTYYGALDNGNGNSCSVDTLGNVYLAGFTNSSNTIATSGAHQTTYGGGWKDAYLVKFDASGTRLWGTYYGGNSEDLGYSCIADGSGNVYLVGTTYSTSGIASSSGHQTILSSGGYCDAFLVKFDGTGTSSGLEDLHENDSPFTLSPNPGKTHLSISGEGLERILGVQVLNTLGQVIYQSPESNSVNTELSLSLPQGIYEVIIETKDAWYAQKWVVAY